MRKSLDGATNLIRAAIYHKKAFSCTINWFPKIPSSQPSRKNILTFYNFWFCRAEILDSASCSGDKQEAGRINGYELSRPTGFHSARFLQKARNSWKRKPRFCWSICWRNCETIKHDWLVAEESYPNSPNTYWRSLCLASIPPQLAIKMSSWIEITCPTAILKSELSFYSTFLSTFAAAAIPFPIFYPTVDWFECDIISGFWGCRIFYKK